MVFRLFDFCFERKKLKRMIELLWKNTLDNDKDVMMMISSLITWLASQLTSNEEYKNLYLKGFLVIRDTKKQVFTLIMCGNEEQNEKGILKILQQPPEEFKERYVPCILSDEPESVQEAKVEVLTVETDSEYDDGSDDDDEVIPSSDKEDMT